MKIMAKVFIGIFIFCFVLFFFPLNVFAHNSNLGIDGFNDITYDDCIPDNYSSSSDIGDGYNEK